MFKELLEQYPYHWVAVDEQGLIVADKSLDVACEKARASTDEIVNTWHLEYLDPNPPDMIPGDFG